MKFRRDLQGLRAVAITMVMLAHSESTIFEGGFVGVDVFFVLSGFLITGILLRELENTGHIDFMRFFSRRLKRLLPALIFMLCGSSCIAIWLLSEVEMHAQLASFPFAATWTSNLYFAFTTVGYFDELASRDLFLHTWSLGLEEQFYLIWPALLLFLYRIGKSQHLPGSSGLQLTFTGLGLAFITSLTLSLYWTVNNPHAAFYLMPSRIWQLSLGAMIYVSFHQKQPTQNSLAHAVGKVSGTLMLAIGLTMIVGSSLALGPDIAYPGFWALIPSTGSALVIIASHTRAESRDSVLTNPWIVWLGDRSYSLYLWHWPIFVLGFALGFQGQLAPIIGMVFLSVLTASLSFRVIEKPFWRGRWSHAAPLRIVLLSILAMASTILAMHHTLEQHPLPVSTTDRSNQWRTDQPVIYTMRCDAGYTHARLEPCTFGADTAKKTVVLLGDSIGAQWFSVIPEIFPEPLWQTIVYTKSSCAIIDENYYYSLIKGPYRVCTDWRNTVIDELDLIRPDILIMGSSATYDFSKTQWIEGTTRILNRVSKSATKVFIIPGTPKLNFNGPGCISRHISEDGMFDLNACIAGSQSKTIQRVTNYLTRAASRFQNVHLLNLNDLVCPNGTCSAANAEEVVVFRDSQHLTDTFVKTQIPYVRERINSYQKYLE